MKKQVGVDIGSTTVRVVEVKGIDSSGHAVISKVGFSPLRAGALVAGRVRNPVAIAQAVSRALRQAGVAPYGFVAGYSGSDAAVARKIMPAALKGDNRVKSLRTMSQEISTSLRLDDAVLDLNQIRTLNRNTPQGPVSMAAVVIGAVSEVEVAELRKVFRLAKCQPRALDLAGAANMRALVRADADGQEVHTVVDIGATKTSIATRQGPHLRSLRQVSVGGAAFTRAIMQVTGDDADAAEARQKVLSLTSSAPSITAELSSGYGTGAPVEAAKGTDSLLDEAVNAVADDLIEQIASSVENDASNYNNTLSQGVVLSGATAQIPGLRDRLAGRLGIPVQLGRPWAVLERNRSNLLLLKDGKEDPRMMMELTTAVGLALWKEMP